MEIHSPGKLLLLSIVVLGCFGLIIADMISGSNQDTTAAWATLTAVIGYLIGNGVGAKKGETQQPLLTPKENPEVKYSRRILEKVVEQVKEETANERS